MITVKEAKLRGIIPEAYHHDIIDICDTSIGGCGSEILTTEELTIQECSNPKCRLKLAGRAIKLLNNFGIKGVGMAYAKRFFTATEMKAHTGILVGTEAEYFSTGYISLSIGLMREIDEIKKEIYTFDNIVSRLGLPNLAEKSFTIFRNFTCFQMFEEFIRIKGISIYDYLIELPGIGDTTANELVETFKTYSVELNTIPGIFKIRPNYNNRLIVAITGETNFHLMSKEEFIKYLNNLGKGFIEVELTKTALESCDYIVCADKYVSFQGRDIVEIDTLQYNFREQETKDCWTSKHNRGIVRSIKEGYEVLITPRELKNIITRERARHEEQN